MRVHQVVEVIAAYPEAALDRAHALGHYGGLRETRKSSYRSSASWSARYRSRVPLLSTANPVTSRPLGMGSSKRSDGRSPSSGTWNSSIGYDCNALAR